MYWDQLPCSVRTTRCFSNILALNQAVQRSALSRGVLNEPAAPTSSDGMDSSRFFRGIIAANRGSTPRNQEETEMDATTVAVDLAKDIFEVALANRAGRIIDRKRLTRRQFERFIES